jgi:NADPH-dependent 2,4-dienoyl-CoA reductase/sulfur reductase-like enzyme
VATSRSEPYDLAVVGAGPAGLACAVEAATSGLRVAVLDQQTRVGGAFYRHSAAHKGAGRPAALHHDWDTFTRLRTRFDEHVATSRIDHLGQHAVWAIEPGFTVHALRGERERAAVRIDAAQVMVASGAYDRTIPFPGWTLPGVMTAGGAQALLKGSLVTPPGPVVVAGTGPLLLVVAAGLLDVGVEMTAVVEGSHPLRYLTKPSGWRGAAGRGPETAAYVGALARHRVPYLAGHHVVAAHGEGRVERVEVTGGLIRTRVRTFDCATLLVSHGFTPQLELLVQLGARTRIDTDGSLVVEVDRAQRTSTPGLLAAGEVTGVGGAALALLEGLVAGRTSAGLDVPDEVRRRIAVQRDFAAAMHRVHQVTDSWTSRVTDDTIVCRCEEVTAGQLRAACHDLGASDGRAAKLLTRTGMGLCQGRTCGRAVEELVSGAAGPTRGGGSLRDIEARTRASARTPAQPVPLSALAGLDGGQQPSG